MWDRQSYKVMSIRKHPFPVESLAYPSPRFCHTKVAGSGLSDKPLQFTISPLFCSFFSDKPLLNN